MKKILLLLGFVLLVNLAFVSGFQVDVGRALSQGACGNYNAGVDYDPLSDPNSNVAYGMVVEIDRFTEDKVCVPISSVDTIFVDGYDRVRKTGNLNPDIYLANERCVEDLIVDNHRNIKGTGGFYTYSEEEGFTCNKQGDLSFASLYDYSEDTMNACEEGYSEIYGNTLMDLLGIEVHGVAPIKGDFWSFYCDGTRSGLVSCSPHDDQFSYFCDGLEGYKPPKQIIEGLNPQQFGFSEFVSDGRDPVLTQIALNSYQYDGLKCFGGVGSDYNDRCENEDPPFGEGPCGDLDGIKTGLVGWSSGSWQGVTLGGHCLPRREQIQPRVRFDYVTGEVIVVLHYGTTSGFLLDYLPEKIYAEGELVLGNDEKIGLNTNVFDLITYPSSRGISYSYEWGINSEEFINNYLSVLDESDPDTKEVKVQVRLNTIAASYGDNAEELVIQPQEIVAEHRPFKVPISLRVETIPHEVDENKKIVTGSVVKDGLEWIYLNKGEKLKLEFNKLEGMNDLIFITQGLQFWNSEGDFVILRSENTVSCSERTCEYEFTDEEIEKIIRDEIYQEDKIIRVVLLEEGISKYYLGSSKLLANNQKDSELYENYPLFLISDELMEEKGLPASLGVFDGGNWIGEGGEIVDCIRPYDANEYDDTNELRDGKDGKSDDKCMYPLLVYHKEGDKIIPSTHPSLLTEDLEDAGVNYELVDVINGYREAIERDEGKRADVYLIRKDDESSSGDDKRSYDKIRNGISGWYEVNVDKLNELWLNEDVIIVDTTTDEFTNMQSQLLSSYYNAIVYYTDDPNWDEIKGELKNKLVFLVGDTVAEVDEDLFDKNLLISTFSSGLKQTHMYPWRLADGDTLLYSDELANLNERLGENEIGFRNVVLVNLNDVNDNFCESKVIGEESFDRLYCGLSLYAPYVAYLHDATIEDLDLDEPSIGITEYQEVINALESEKNKTVLDFGEIERLQKELIDFNTEISRIAQVVDSEITRRYQNDDIDYAIMLGSIKAIANNYPRFVNINGELSEASWDYYYMDLDKDGETDIANDRIYSEDILGLTSYNSGKRYLYQRVDDEDECGDFGCTDERTNLCFSKPRDVYGKLVGYDRQIPEGYLVGLIEKYSEKSWAWGFPDVSPIEVDSRRNKLVDPRTMENYIRCHPTTDVGAKSVTGLFDTDNYLFRVAKEVRAVKSYGNAPKIDERMQRLALAYYYDTMGRLKLGQLGAVEGIASIDHLLGNQVFAGSSSIINQIKSDSYSIEDVKERIDYFEGNDITGMTLDEMTERTVWALRDIFMFMSVLEDVKERSITERNEDSKVIFRDTIERITTQIDGVYARNYWLNGQHFKRSDEFSWLREKVFLREKYGVPGVEVHHLKDWEFGDDDWKTRFEVPVRAALIRQMNDNRVFMTNYLIDSQEAVHIMSGKTDYSNLETVAKGNVFEIENEQVEDVLRYTVPLPKINSFAMDDDLDYKTFMVEIGYLHDIFYFQKDIAFQKETYEELSQAVIEIAVIGTLTLGLGSAAMDARIAISMIDDFAVAGGRGLTAARGLAGLGTISYDTYWLGVGWNYAINTCNKIFSEEITGWDSPPIGIADQRFGPAVAKDFTNCLRDLGIVGAGSVLVSAPTVVRGVKSLGDYTNQNIGKKVLAEVDDKFKHDMTRSAIAADAGDDIQSILNPETHAQKFALAREYLDGKNIKYTIILEDVVDPSTGQTIEKSLIRIDSGTDNLNSYLGQFAYVVKEHPLYGFDVVVDVDTSFLGQFRPEVDKGHIVISKDVLFDHWTLTKKLDDTFEHELFHGVVDVINRNLVDGEDSIWTSHLFMHPEQNKYSLVAYSDQSRLDEVAANFGSAARKLEDDIAGKVRILEEYLSETPSTRTNALANNVQNSLVLEFSSLDGSLEISRRLAATHFDAVRSIRGKLDDVLSTDINDIHLLRIENDLVVAAYDSSNNVRFRIVLDLNGDSLSFGRKEIDIRFDTKIVPNAEGELSYMIHINDEQFFDEILRIGNSVNDGDFVNSVQDKMIIKNIVTDHRVFKNIGDVEIAAAKAIAEIQPLHQLTQDIISSYRNVGASRHEIVELTGELMEGFSNSRMKEEFFDLIPLRMREKMGGVPKIELPGDEIVGIYRNTQVPPDQIKVVTINTGLLPGMGRKAVKVTENLDSGLKLAEFLIDQTDTSNVKTADLVIDSVTKKKNYFSIYQGFDNVDPHTGLRITESPAHSRGVAASMMDDIDPLITGSRIFEDMTDLDKSRFVGWKIYKEVDGSGNPIKVWAKREGELESLRTAADQLGVLTDSHNFNEAYEAVVKEIQDINSGINPNFDLSDAYLPEYVDLNYVEYPISKWD